MSDTNETDARRPSADEAAEGGPPRKRLAGWQKPLLAVSVVLMVAGLGLQAWSALSGGDEPASPAVPAEGSAAGSVGPGGSAVEPSGFLPLPDGQGGDGVDPEVLASVDDGGGSGGLGAWSPMIFRLGFSFFVGFAIAYAVRTFVKISIIAIGLMLIVLFGLQYAGVISVDWSAMEGHYDAIVAWLGEQTASFTAFIQGYLPSAAMAGLGLVIGFKKK